MLSYEEKVYLGRVIYKHVFIPSHLLCVSLRSALTDQAIPAATWNC
jgi:hypothetical protein